MDEQPNIHTIGEGKSFHEQIDEVRKVMEENLRYTKVIHQFTPKDAITKEQEMQKLLNDNLQYSKACYALLEKLNKWLFWHKVLSVVKILLILVPIILGIIYLPPLIKAALDPYVELLGEVKSLK